jgi:hypothetical protein
MDNVQNFIFIPCKYSSGTEETHETLYRTVSGPPETRTGNLQGVSFVTACHKPPYEQENDWVLNVAMCEGYITVVFPGDWRATWNPVKAVDFAVWFRDLTPDDWCQFALIAPRSFARNATMHCLVCSLTLHDMTGSMDLVELGVGKDNTYTWRCVILVVS